MNRYIVFKARTKNPKDLGAWYIGYYVKNDFEGTARIYTGESFNTYQEVDPETVCQFSGIFDKKGRPIFEHDILVERVANNRKDSKKSPKKVKFVCEFKCGSFWTSTNIFEETTIDNMNADVEIVGNEFDTKEILPCLPQ